MRTSFLSVLAIVIASASVAQTLPTDSTGLPGDQFSLEGALELFKNATDLDAFEKALNAEDHRVNNLDLDGNGEVDYLRVVDHVQSDAHAIVLQVMLGKEEAQDVAVIELEKNGPESAVLQIRGAEELYGTDVIVEPFEEKEEGPALKGPAPPEDLPRVRVWLNVWAWPCVTWIYGPTYVVWNSPWYWGYYPPWWRPWRPWGWNAWYGWHRPYHGWYQPVHTCRVTNAHAVYQHRSSFSPTVRARTNAIKTSRPGKTPAQVRPVQRQAPAAKPSRPDKSIKQRNTNVRPAAKPASKPARNRNSAPARSKPR